MRPVASLAGCDPDVLSELDAFVEEAVRRRVFPGATLAFGRSEGDVVARAYGRLTYEGASPAVTVRTRYDLASLTKVVAPTTATMLLLEEGRIGLDDPVARHLPEFGRAGKERVTLRHLLTHSAGLVAYPDYPVARWTTAEALLAAVFDAPPLYEPGTEMRYGEASMIVLALVVERVARTGLATFVRERVLGPLGMRDTGIFSSSERATDVAPTGFDDRLRHRMLHGEVHAPMAALLGGLCGSAGLFSDVLDVARFARAMLRGGRAEGAPFLREETVRLFTTVADRAVTDSRALGWDTRSPSGYTVAGRFLGPASYGHTGDTGTSVWIDPEADVFVALLSNRTYPSRHDRAHVHVRPVVSDFAWRACAGLPRA